MEEPGNELQLPLGPPQSTSRVALCGRGARSPLRVLNDAPKFRAECLRPSGTERWRRNRSSAVRLASLQPRPLLWDFTAALTAESRQTREALQG
uniref:Uncharacterized protein n=1 Tax=Knipowitschia caucasica TaxID=637954 RepID=A0AAV2MLA3_KNICA